MDRRSFVLFGALVLAQATTEEFKGKADVPPPRPLTAEPRGGVWAAPPGESGASRHAPRPGPGDAPSAETEDVPRIELEGRDADAGS